MNKMLTSADSSFFWFIFQMMKVQQFFRKQR